MSDEQLSDWILDLSRLCKSYKNKRRRFDFDDPHDVPEEDYHHLLGVTKPHFEEMLTSIGSSLHKSCNRTPRSALAIFLMFMRHNLSQNVLGLLFGINNQSSMSNTISRTSAALYSKFVPKYLGFDHINREDALRDHSNDMFYKLFEAHPGAMFLIMDGTYIYIEKPSDFRLQKLTWSEQKKRNLIKPFMIIFADGYILDAAGPYFATGKNNDAGILKSIVKLLAKSKDYFKRGDHFVLDRGFRDSISMIEEMGIIPHMPGLLKKGEKQFPTSVGNQSRLVTLVRWLVEAVNGRIKKKFKLFRDVVPGRYLEKIGTFFKIACAMINAFSPPLTKNSEENSRIAERALQLVEKENLMQTRVIEEKLNRNTKSWKSATTDTVQEFPILTYDELKIITLGIYQIGLAKRYAALHMKDSGDYKILLNDEFPGVVRAKLESRFKSNKTHNLWIEFDAEQSGVDSIVQYYCCCKQGARVVGCCSHVCCVLWYLGYQRHQVSTQLKVRRRVLGIIDAGKDIEMNEDDSSEEDEAEDEDGLEQIEVRALDIIDVGEVLQMNEPGRSEESESEDENGPERIEIDADGSEESLMDI